MTRRSLTAATAYGEGLQNGDLPGGIQLTQQLRNSTWSQKRCSLPYFADKALNAAAAFWFLTAVIGQWMFAIYILSFYGRALAEGDLARWNQVVSPGYIPGDRMGNFALAAHLLVAVIITVGGPLQLIPQIRARAPLFHRWNGRIYIFTAFMVGITALYLVWIRGGIFGNVVQHAGISGNAVLIMFCAAMALRSAMVREFGVHRRWALRLFMVVGGAWFIRIGSMFWMILIRSPAGFNPEIFQGPMLNFLSFAQYLIPLVVLELYLRTEDHAGASGKFAMSAGLLVLTIAMGVGIFGAVTRLWLPHL
jgi:hypothetical protein